MTQRRVIKKTPEERCAYFLRISRHYQKENDPRLAVDYATKGLELARKHNLEAYRASFEEIIRQPGG
ncbi:MAG: hypothetical protein D6795_01420 [Deltaproteobacteria bacterium]|nr:MAG: hypothetical protein D6795_01420 [Deltaproteobacteria bacterium]